MILENIDKVLIYSILGVIISSHISLRSAFHFTAQRRDNDIAIKPCVYLQTTKNSHCKQQAFRNGEKK